MDMGNRGRLRLAVLVGLVAVAVGVTATTGFVFADDDTTGEDVLEDVEEKYNTADSVSTDAVVTVETDNGTAEFDASIAAAGNDSLRLNVSDGERYVLSGTNGETTWIYEPRTGVTGVLEWADGGEVTASLRAGTDDPTAGLSELLPVDEVEPDDTVSDILSEVDEEELPPEFRAELDELPENATVSELADEADVDGELENISEDDLAELNASGVLEGVDVPEEWDESALAEEWDESALAEEWDESALAEEWNESALAEEWNESALAEEWDESALAEEWNESALAEEWNESALAEEWNETALVEEWNESEWPESHEELHEEFNVTDELTGEFNASDPDLSVKLVNTTTVDGERAHELLITHPDAEGDTRLWVAVDSHEVLKLETTTPDATVTVDVVETRFDVSPADSTFEPPGATELARLTVTSTDTADGFGADAPFQVAVPGEGWTFERGGTVAGGTSFVSDGAVESETVGLAAEYTDGERSILVTQSEAPGDWGEGPRTVTVGDREVVVTTTEHGVAGTWVEDGTTTTVAGNLSESELLSVIEDVTLESTAG
jgi:outer membrane lipoprotein-sorting protein